MTSISTLPLSQPADGYAPSEQLSWGQVYPASDLYAMGTTCLHLITGIHPLYLFNANILEWIWRDELIKLNNQISPELSTSRMCFMV